MPASTSLSAGAVILSAAICLVGLAQYDSAETAYQRQNQDPYLIAAQVTRFEPVHSALPPGVTLGYISDAEAGSTMDSVLLRSAAYALAPHLVDPGVQHDWVVGNFTQPRDFAALGQSKGLQLQKDFGNGVVLYRRSH